MWLYIICYVGIRNLGDTTCGAYRQVTDVIDKMVIQCENGKFDVQRVGSVVFIPKDEVELVKKEVKRNGAISK